MGSAEARYGRSLRLFLVDGAPTGLMIAEIVNWTGKALVVPRSALPDFLRRDEAKNAGIYILSGFDPEEPLRPLIYVGESENVGIRLRTHDGDEAKEFFERAIVFVSKDENLTKAHARYLEARLISKARAADRAKLVNGNEPGTTPLPEADRSDMEYFISQVELILPVLGLDILRPQSVIPEPDLPTIISPQDPSDVKALAPTFVYTEVGTNAEAEEVGNEFIVKAGSLARVKETPTIPGRAHLLRKQYIDDGTLILSDDTTLLRFTRDVAFGSPSGAAQIVYGGSNNGRSFWKVKGTSQSYGDWRDEKMSLTSSHS